MLHGEPCVGNQNLIWGRKAGLRNLTSGSESRVAESYSTICGTLCCRLRNLVRNLVLPSAELDCYHLRSLMRSLIPSFSEPYFATCGTLFYHLRNLMRNLVLHFTICGTLRGTLFNHLRKLVFTSSSAEMRPRICGNEGPELQKQFAGSAEIRGRICGNSGPDLRKSKSWPGSAEYRARICGN